MNRQNCDRLYALIYILHLVSVALDREKYTQFDLKLTAGCNSLLLSLLTAVTEQWCVKFDEAIMVLVFVGS